MITAEEAVVELMKLYSEQGFILNGLKFAHGAKIPPSEQDIENFTKLGLQILDLAHAIEEKE